LDEKWLGKQLDALMIARLVELQGQYGLALQVKAAKSRRLC
jgi:diphthamide synthase (EF-2-diphthine--ammonia ligase)